MQQGRPLKYMLSAHTLCLLLLACQLSLAQAAAVEPAEEELIIVELLFEKQQLSDSLFAYRLKNKLFLPLEEFAGLLDFPLTVNTTARTAEGWFIQPERTFKLDLNRNTVTLARTEHNLPNNHAIISRDGDLYIPETLLEQWFPIHLELNFSDMRLSLSSDEPLPLQQRLQRQKQRMYASQNTQPPPVSYREDIYHWANYPTLDLTFNTAFADQTNSLTTALSASGDLLKHAAYLSYNNSNQSDSQSIRFNLTRHAPTPEKRLSGGLFSYRLGDLYTPGDSLISSGGDGVGLALTSSTSRQYTRYNDTVIEGDAPAGWEAELYLNGNLLAFQTTSNDGVYRFADVDLWYGNNNFEVRLFGPQGQTHTKHHSRYIGDSQLQPGSSSYAFYALNEKHSRLFGSPVTPGDKHSKYDLRAELNYGLTDNWSIGAAWSQLEREEYNHSRRHNYLSLSNDLSLNGTFIQTTFSFDSLGGHAALLATRATLGRQNISLQHRQFSHFSSEESPLNNPREHDTQLRLNGHFNNGRYYSYSLTAKQENFAQAANRYELSSHLSTQLAGINLTQNQTLSKQSGRPGVHLPGSISASRYNAGGGVSAALNYSLHDNSNLLRSISTTLHSNLDNRKHNLLRLTYTPDASAQWAIQNDLTWKLDTANLTLHASTDDKHHWRAGAALNFSTGFDNIRQRPWFSSNTSSKSGKVNAQIFLDRDNTGTFSPGDQPLSGVSLAGTRVSSHQPSNKTGHLQLRSLPSFQPITVSIDDSTLEDPFWQLREQPDSLYLHAGAQAELALPVIAISEVEGYMLSADNEGQYPIKSTRMLLVNEKGDVVATTWSEFDGLFLFENVQPGNYQVQADDELLNKKNLSRPTPLPVVATADGGVVNIGTTVLYSRSIVQKGSSAPGAAFSTIKGSIYAGDKTGRRPVTAALMQLLGEQGMVVATTYSDSEGAFLFQDVIPGSYQVKADPVSLARDNLSIPSPQTVIAPMHGAELNLGSTVLYRKAVVNARHKNSQRQHSHKTQNNNG